jgi:TolB-like protein
MQIMPKPGFILLSLILLGASLAAQTSVAVGDFENRTDRLYLDSWTKKIPEFLCAGLSRFSDMAVVDRGQIKTLLDERKLQASGLTDSSRVAEIGRLLSAEFLVAGAVSESGGWVRIDARIISVASGRMVSEMVMCRSSEHLEAMVSLLAGNLRVQMTNKGDYRESVLLRKAPTKYFLGATMLAAAVTSAIHSGYRVRMNDYQKETRLDEFQPKYDSANRWHRLRTAAISVTAAALAGTVVCLVQDLSPARILANPQPVRPVFNFDSGEIIVGLQIEF